jgi:hypothetical protein
MMNALAPCPNGPTLALRQECRIAPKRILHVDDEAGIRELVELSLGLEPDFVTRGVAARARRPLLWQRFGGPIWFCLI